MKSKDTYILQGENIPINISVVVPIFNEEDSLGTLYSRIRNVLKAYGDKSEIIFVDDGSTDTSYEILRHIGYLDKSVKVFKFYSNEGQHKALEKGLHKAQADVVVTIDGDLQTDPEDIPELIARLKDGFDIVCGWRWPRKDPWFKILKSIIGNYIQRKVTGLKLHDMSCTMRAYRKDIVKDLTLQDKHEIGLLPYILSKHTNGITEMKINHHRRTSGKSNYGFLSTSLGTIRCYIRLILNNGKM